MKNTRLKYCYNKNFHALALGQSVGVFSIEFTYLGTGTPDIQAFEIYDPDFFFLLEKGTTTLGQIIDNTPTTPTTPLDIASTNLQAVPTLSAFNLIMLYFSLCLIALTAKQTHQLFYTRLK